MKAWFGMPCDLRGQRRLAQARKDVGRPEWINTWYAHARDLGARFGGSFTTNADLFVDGYGGYVPEPGSPPREAWENLCREAFRAMDRRGLWDVVGDPLDESHDDNEDGCARVHVLDIEDTPHATSTFGKAQAGKDDRVIPAVLTASNPNSLRAAKSKHLRRLRGFGARCETPEECKVCSTNTDRNPETSFAVAPVSRNPGPVSAGTPDAPTTPAHEGVRDYRSYRSSRVIPVVPTPSTSLDDPARIVQDAEAGDVRAFVDRVSTKLSGLVSGDAAAAAEQLAIKARAIHPKTKERYPLNQWEAAVDGLVRKVRNTPQGEVPLNGADPMAYLIGMVPGAGVQIELRTDVVGADRAAAVKQGLTQEDLDRMYDEEMAAVARRQEGVA